MPFFSLFVLLLCFVFVGLFVGLFVGRRAQPTSGESEARTRHSFIIYIGELPCFAIIPSLLCTHRARRTLLSDLSVTRAEEGGFLVGTVVLAAYLSFAASSLRSCVLCDGPVVALY